MGFNVCSCELAVINGIIRLIAQGNTGYIAIHNFACFIVILSVFCVHFGNEIEQLGHAIVYH